MAGDAKSGGEKGKRLREKMEKAAAMAQRTPSRTSMTLRSHSRQSELLANNSETESGNESDSSNRAEHGSEMSQSSSGVLAEMDTGSELGEAASSQQPSGSSRAEGTAPRSMSILETLALQAGRTLQETGNAQESGSEATASGPSVDPDEFPPNVYEWPMDVDWPVEAVLRKRMHRDTNKVEYYIKWERWDKYFNSWEPEENLEGCKELVDEFNKKLEERSRKRVRDEYIVYSLVKRNNNNRKGRNRRQGLRIYKRKAARR